MRTGIIAVKSGMTRIFTEDGRHVPVTMLSVDGCVVIDQKTQSKNGYDAVLVGANVKPRHKFNKPTLGFFRKAGQAPCALLKEFRVTEDAQLEPGTVIKADHFSAGQLVDVTARTKGKGFAGGMKRWGFGGLRASHGVSVSHRSLGSTGQRQDPGKVFKGKKMPGHMGDRQVTTQSLEVVAVDMDANIIFVKGAVPGNRGTVVHVRDAVKAKS